MPKRFDDPIQVVPTAVVGGRARDRARIGGDEPQSGTSPGYQVGIPRNRETVRARATYTRSQRSALSGRSSSALSPGPAALYTGGHLAYSGCSGWTIRRGQQMERDVRIFFH